MIPNPIAAILHNTRDDRYHPIIYREAPLPGNPEHLVRHKSLGHHTQGFATRDEAVRDIERMGQDQELKGMRFCDETYAWDPDQEPIPADVAFFQEVDGKLKRMM